MCIHKWIKCKICFSILLASMTFNVSCQDIVIPLTYRNGANPMIEVKVNGKGPFKFMFDTGSPGFLKLDEGVFEKLQLIKTDSILAGDGSGQNDSWHGLTTISTIDIGGYRIKDAQAMVRNYNRRLNLDRVDGIIGLDFFIGKTVSFDFKKNTCTISSDLLHKNDPHVIRTPIERGIPTTNLNIGGQIINAVFDTGNTGNVTLHESDVTSDMIIGNPIVVGRAQTVNNTFEIKQAQLKEPMVIAGISIENVLININGLLPKANLGINFLKQFNLTFDFGNELCRIEKNGSTQSMVGQNKSPYNEYTGQYGDRTITTDESGHLYIQRPGGAILKMILKEKDIYGLEIVADATLVFERNSDNKIIAIKVKRGATWEKAERMN